MPKIRPQNHRSIKTRLSNQARAAGIDPADMQNRFFRELFLAQIFQEDQGSWVLKGGTNLYCRIPGARHTRDLDLFCQDPTGAREAAQELKDRMDHVRVGPYQFTIGDPKPGGDNIDVYSLKVTVLTGVQKAAEFSVDVSGDLQVPDVPRNVIFHRDDDIEIDGVPRSFPIRSYPVSNQIADKTCAMYEVHGTRPSTRYRDLYDLALIVAHLSFSASETVLALDQQREIRRLNLPSALNLPDPEWVKNYPRVMKNTPGTRTELHPVNAALDTARVALDPLLRGDLSEGTWSPHQQTWINN